MYRFTIAVCLIFLVSFASLALADIPKLINYQGMLTDDGGIPLTGLYDLTFYIYDDTSGGNLEWSETQNGVQVQNGLFNVVLGKNSTLDLAFDQSYWLAVKVGTETMPRVRITSVGYAYRAEKSDTANYAHSSPSDPGGYTWTFRITDGGDTTITTSGCWGIARNGNTLYGNADSTHVNLGVASTTGSSGRNYKYCTVGGGYYNTASGYGSTIGGGYKNTADTNYATVGGGYYNTASGYYATVGGGVGNDADTNYATVGGGRWNTANERYATVGGGYNNTGSGYYATVGGGYSDTASGYSATVGGGYNNTASGDYSFAAGRRAKANHTGTFVWADGTNADFASTGNNQFLIRASGGVGIGTNSPEAMLHVQNATEGVIKVGTPTANGYATVIFEEGNADAMALRYDGSTNELRIDDETTDNTRMVIERSSGDVGIGTTDPAQKLDVNGIVRVRSWGSTPTYNVQVNNNGDLCRVSSSKRYKKNIRGLESDMDKILELKPVSFEWKTTSEQDIGLIAEEVQELIPELVGYDKEGRPDAVRYELVSLYLLELMKDQVQVMQKLKTENEELKQRIEVLESR
jgi:hypothetical protein